jgi:hypothetical protein
MTKENSFLDENYKIPETSNYMKFRDGDNQFRVLSSAITGWEYWDKNNKPVRRKEEWNTVPDDIRQDSEIKHFWAFVVWNYNDQRVQVLELTQKGIMKFIRNLTKNKAWGNPKGYDIVVNKSGSGLGTEYSYSSNPPSEVDAAITKKFEIMKVNLEALYSNDDPFKSNDKENVEVENLYDKA